MLHPVSAFWRISAGWTQWIRQRRITLPKLWMLLAEKGIASVTRVMSDPHKDIGLNILSKFHYGPEVRIATFGTLADALQSLAEDS